GKHFDGWGGNFVFGLENCPVPEFMLTTTRTAWARTGMSLHLWEPQNDNSDPDTPDWSRFRSRIDLDDGKETELEREMRMAGRIAELGIPHIISVWYIPDWMQPEGDGSRVPEQNWPELMESVGTYLLFLRERFGAEPDYFSFNEPDLGVYVLQSPDEHARRIVQLGGYFGQLGLKTKLLLGDTANASNPAYAETAARTPGVLDYARVLAFHSWNGTISENYRRWSELADGLNLPLAVTEVGSDPAAWHFPDLFFDYGYALDDLANYFGFLVDARPQAALQWEYSCDYPLVHFENDGITYSARYWFVKQLADLTPPRAQYLNVDSSNPDVQVVGFRSVPEGGGSDSAGDIEYVFHVANLGPARTITLEGLPAALRDLSGVITNAEQSFATLPTNIIVTAGVAVFQLPEQSLLSLQGSVSPKHSLSLPHFGAGQGLSTRVNLVSLDPEEPSYVRLVFRDPQGKPIHPVLTGADLGEIELPPNGMAAVRADPVGDDLLTGWVSVYSDRKVAAGLLFSGAVGTAGVVPSPPLPEGALVPIEYAPAEAISTGVALANQAGTHCDLTLRLHDSDGNLLATAEPDSVPPLGHLARFVHEFEWSEPIPADFRFGLLEIIPTQPISVIALQTRPGEFATLPVASRTVSERPGELLFPQTAHVEGQLSSRIWIINPDRDREVGIRVEIFFDEEKGDPQEPTPQILLNGIAPTEGAWEWRLPAGALLALDTSGSDPFVGAARVTADGPIVGTLLFAGIVGAAGVGASPVYPSGFIAPVPGVPSEGIRTGLALWNRGYGEAQIRFEVYGPDGVRQAEAHLELDQGEHRALYLDEIPDWSPPWSPSSPGTVRVISDQPLSATVLVTSQETFATLPVVDLPHNASPAD
ncbi:MAG TPA: hypothetical protein P5568_12860, partial [Acidobacteriota bacterium]|nr:hypothetical protein [Acidobacteriota bacterium]